MKPVQSQIIDQSTIDREKELADERSTKALTLQRKQRLQALVQKRKSNFSYLVKVHNGGCFWLNVAHFSRNDIKNYAKDSAKSLRALTFFSLGVSVSRILILESGLSTVRAFSQLMEEWEYHNYGATMQSVKFVMAKNSNCIFPQTTPLEGASELHRPQIFKFQNTVVYEYLQVPHVAFELDYVEVLISLCGQMIKLYEKLYHEECFRNQTIYDTIVRLDSRVKHHVINLISKELTEVAIKRGKEDLKNLRNCLQPISKPSNPATIPNNPPLGSNITLATVADKKEDINGEQGKNLSPDGLKAKRSYHTVGGIAFKFGPRDHSELENST